MRVSVCVCVVPLFCLRLGVLSRSDVFLDAADSVVKAGVWALSRLVALPLCVSALFLPSLGPKLRVLGLLIVVTVFNGL